MKCHYINVPDHGKVLIPWCMEVVHSNDMELCTCRRETRSETESQFERVLYNERVDKLKGIIEKQKKEIEALEKAFFALNRVVGKLSNRNSKKRN